MTAANVGHQVRPRGGRRCGMSLPAKVRLGPHSGLEADSRFSRRMTDRDNARVIGEHRPRSKPSCHELPPLVRFPVGWSRIRHSSHVGGVRRHQDGQICAEWQWWINAVARSTCDPERAVRALENRATEIDRRRPFAGSTRPLGAFDDGMQTVRQHRGNVGRWDHSKPIFRHGESGPRRWLVPSTSVESPQDTDLDEQEFEIALTVRTYAHGTRPYGQLHALAHRADSEEREFQVLSWFTYYADSARGSSRSSS
jgi:hypothetical protein